MEDLGQTVEAAFDKKNDTAAQIAAKSRDLDRLLKDLKGLANQEGGEWLGLELQSIDTELKTVKRRITSTVFWRMCPLCGGKGCKECKKIGWLSRDREKYLSREAKEAIGE